VSTLSKSLAAGAVAFVLAAAPAKAQMWYNGNWNGITGLASERNLWVPDSRVYDNFLVGGNGWTVTEIFGDFLSSLSPSEAYWEIRSGVSAGNGGTLLHSGLSSITWSWLGGGAWGYDQYRATVGGLNFVLPAGVYWLTIAPTQSIGGRAFINTTAGSNGVNSLLDGNSFWDSKTFNKNFVPTSTQWGTSADFSYGVNGQQYVAITTDDGPGEGEGDVGLSTVTPEPGTVFLTATGLGLVSLGVRLRRRAKTS